MDCSTIHPDTTNAIAKQVHDKGAEFVAMPVFGAPAAADAGQLVCVMAGPGELVERVKPFTTGVIGRAVIDLSGQEPGKASLLKVSNHLACANFLLTHRPGHRQYIHPADGRGAIRGDGLVREDWARR